MPVVQLLSSNASDPVDARLQTFGDIIDVDVSAVGRWLRRCARRSGCATCINCAAKFTPTRRYTSATWNSYEYSRVCARDHQREVLYKERGENNGRPDP